MEFTLKNTDVFDDNLYEKITNELHVLEDWYDPKLSYKLSVVFSSRLNHDNRMKEFYAKIPPKENQVKKEITVKDIVGDVLSFQLQKVVDAFRNYSGIEFDTAAIKIFWFMWNPKICYQKGRCLQCIPLCQMRT